MVALTSLSPDDAKGSSPAAAFRRKVEWLLSPEHFQFKLLLGTAVGVLVIVVLAITCFVISSGISSVPVTAPIPSA